MEKFEFEPDDHTIFMGVITQEIDDDVVIYNVERFSIIVYIDGIDHDVTSAISPTLYDLYQEDFKQKYIDSLGDS